MKLKVLFIYPTPFEVTGLPVGLASLSAVLKENDYEIKMFDTAFYPNPKEGSQTKLRAERGMTKAVSHTEKYWKVNNTDLGEDLINLIRDYKPDIIGISLLEPMHDISVYATNLIKRNFSKIPIVVGGVFPTLTPEVFVPEDSIDIICLGEGEGPFLELCERIYHKQSYLDVKGFWIKDKGAWHKNAPVKLHNINKLPDPDFTEFDERLFYKPMQGKVYKMVNVETSRGCPFQCTYCAAPELLKFHKEQDDERYSRRMENSKVMDQIYYQIDKHQPEFIYFSSESFLSMSTQEEFDEFIKAYDKIRIPFWIQTRPETLSKRRLLALKDVGMHWMTIGLEHGNHDFRKDHLKRKYSGDQFISKMEVLRDLDMGASLNNIIGFPFETRELIFDTINLNRELWQRNHKLETNVFLFTPFRGSELYKVCRDNNFLDDIPPISHSLLSDISMLNFPQEFKNELKGLLKTFNLYVRLPAEYFEKIKIAERDDEEGRAMLKELTDLLHEDELAYVTNVPH